MAAAYLKLKTCGKIPFLTEQQAWNAIRKLPVEALRRDRKPGHRIVAYFCIDCGYWHMGHDKRLPVKAAVPVEQHEEQHEQQDSA